MVNKWLKILKKSENWREIPEEMYLERVSACFNSKVKPDLDYEFLKVRTQRIETREELFKVITYILLNPNKHSIPYLTSILRHIDVDCYVILKPLFKLVNLLMDNHSDSVINILDKQSKIKSDAIVYPEVLLLEGYELDLIISKILTCCYGITIIANKETKNYIGKIGEMERGGIVRLAFRRGRGSVLGGMLEKKEWKVGGLIDVEIDVETEGTFLFSSCLHDETCTHVYNVV